MAFYVRRQIPGLNPGQAVKTTKLEYSRGIYFAKLLQKPYYGLETMTYLLLVFVSFVS